MLCCAVLLDGSQLDVGPAVKAHWLPGCMNICAGIGTRSRGCLGLQRGWEVKNAGLVAAEPEDLEGTGDLMLQLISIIGEQGC